MTEKILVLDTETANTITTENGLDMSDVLVYDCGWAVVDRYGEVYETVSYVNRDIFLYERELMRSAYYAKKIPIYFRDIQAGNRKVASLYEIRKALLETLDKWKIVHVCAHNAKFDRNALNRTQSYVTKSKYRWFVPFDRIIWWDSMKMAQSVVAKMPTYIKYCEKNGYTTKTGKPRVTAEVLYRFITKNPKFKESHTGLEDVLIEKEIMAYCFRQHKKMEKELYSAKVANDPPTDFVRQLYASLRATPTLKV